MQPQPDYGFIMNADHKPKKPLLPTGNSKQARIFIVVGGALALITVIIIVMSLLSSVGKAGKTELIKAAQEQAEIIRISDEATERTKGTSAKNLARTTAFSLKSDQTVLLKALSSQGTKLKPAQLAANKNQATDTLLMNAEQSNRYDEVYTETVQKLLTEYQQTLKNAYDATSSQSLKQTLSEQFEHADLLANAKQ